MPLNPGALQFVVEDFKNPKVGGVTCMTKANEKYVFASNLDLASYARKLENKSGSIFEMSGPFAAFRKSLVSTIDEGIFSSDTDLGICAGRKGFREVFDQRISSHVDQWIMGRPKTVIDALKN